MVFTIYNIFNFVREYVYFLFISVKLKKMINFNIDLRAWFSFTIYSQQILMNNMSSDSIHNERCELDKIFR